MQIKDSGERTQFPTGAVRDLHSGKAVSYTHLIDGRSISPDQRRKIYATLRDISDWTGYTPEETKAILKYDYIASEGVPYFSLSDVDMTTANGFLSHLIDFCIRHGVPTYDTPLLDRAPDVYRYLYSCLANKRCCITGRSAELHHVDACL